MPNWRTLRSRVKGYADPSRILRLSPAAWYRADTGVTGTLNASNWADQSGNGRDLVQGTAGNQPIILPYSGTPYAWLPAVNGNAFATPDAAANDITGDIAIVVLVALDDYTPSSQGAFLSKFSTSNDRAYEFRLNTDGTVSLGTTPGSDAAIVTATSSVVTGITDGALKYLAASRDVDDGAGNNVTKFWLSDDGSSWTQLGTTQTIAGTTSIANSADSVFVGGRNAASTLLGPGKCYRAQLYNGIPPMLGGSGSASPVLDFNPADFTETSTNGATAVSSTTGETWTLNSTGAKPAQIVKSASLMGDGSNHKMATAAFTLNQPFTEYIVAKQITWTAGDYLTSGVGGAAGITQRTGTPKLGLNAGSGVADNTGAALGSKVILTAVFNGASSSLAVNNGTPTTGDPGAGNPGGLSLFSDDAGANYGNAQVYERIVFSAAHDAAERSVVRNYLAARHQIAL